MEEPDFDIKKDLILAKLDAAISMLEKIQLEHDLVGITDVITTLEMVEKDVKDY